MNLRCLLVLSILITLSNGYNVLVMSPFNGKSHFLYMQSFVRALLERGHQVTFLTSNTLSQQKLANYSEVLIDPPYDLNKFFPQDALLSMGEVSPFIFIKDMPQMTSVMNKHAFESANVQKFIHSTDLHFDVIINEEFFGDSYLMFAHKFKAPIITICPFGITNYVDLQKGLVPPVSIAAHWMLPYTDNMTFSQRFYNAMLSIYDWVVREYLYIPLEEEVAKKYFAHLAPLPSLNDLMRNISVSFVNTNKAISPMRPAMPGTVSIGGAHIKPAKLLPKDLQTFLDESKNGVIYFSLGTVVQSSKLPREKIQAFLDAFRNLKQRVLWKFEDESLTNIPPNVMIRKWMPQNDILAHPNVILFISHGGLFGTTESIYHATPLLLIPFFGDQHRNAHRISMTGYGKYLPFNEVTKDTLSAKINEIISDESFLNRAKYTASVFKDNLLHPMDEAVFWIEHVAKFKGAKHLKSHAVDMSMFTYLSLDVLFATFVVVFSFLFAIQYLIRKIVFKKKVQLVNDKKNK